MTDVRNAARDAAYISVGLGVLAYQRAQVRRRELQQQVESQLAGTGEQLQKLTKQVEGRITPVIAQLTGRGKAALAELAGDASSSEGLSSEGRGRSDLRQVPRSRRTCRRRATAASCPPGGPTGTATPR